MSDLVSRIDRAEKNLDRLLEWVTRHDGRTSIVLGIDTAMIGVLLSLAPSFDKWQPVTYLGVVLTLLMIGASLSHVYAGHYPNVDVKHRSLLFFGTMAKRSLGEFISESKSQTDEQYLEDLLEQCHINAEIVSSKFHHLRWSLRLLLLALLPWAATIYILNYSASP